MSKKQKGIIIVYGLPGSGKTHYIESLADFRYNEYVDLDKILKEHASNKEAVLTHLGETVANKIGKTAYRYQHSSVFVDGLITTNQQLRDVIDAIKVKCGDNYQLVFTLVYWNEDRAACLHNDRGRRNLSSEISIKHLTYEKPNLSLFPELPPKRVMEKKVVMKSPAIAWASEILNKTDISDYDRKQFLNGMAFYSESWSLGGTYGNCWDDHLGTISPEEPPSSFTLFDSLIETIYPDISFLKYKKIYAECVSTVINHEGDYYGGSLSKCKYVCDLQKLYDCLTEMNLITSS